MQQRRWIITALLLVAGLASRAQLGITLQVPPNGVLLKNQLWNLVILSSSDNSLSVTIGLTLTRSKDNQPVLSAETRTILVAKGAKQVRYEDAAPVKYTYLSSAVNIDRDPNGFLPIGSFTACYTVSTYQHETRVLLAEDCVPVEVEPMSPPLLNLPADGAIVESLYPQLNWLPPAPLNLFSHLNYDLKLVEVLKGQSPMQAMDRNLPVYSVNSSSPFSNYPASSRALDTGRLYAWRVVARNNNEFAGQSETWTFRLSSKALSTTVKDLSYYKLKKGNESAYAICTGLLKLEYNNEVNDSTVHYRITDLEKPRAVPIKEGNWALVYGQNLVDMPLDRVLVHKGRYLLQLVNSRNETWGINFTYMDPDKQ